MSKPLTMNCGKPIEQNQPLILNYESEDDLYYSVAGLDGIYSRIPKNRAVPVPFLDHLSQPLTPAFRLLVLAFLGLAPAGLGTLVLAPLAALWALVILATRPLTRGDTIRVMIILGIVAGLLALAIPLSRLFLARLSS